MDIETATLFMKDKIHNEKTLNVGMFIVYAYAIIYSKQSKTM